MRPLGSATCLVRVKYTSPLVQVYRGFSRLHGMRLNVSATRCIVFFTQPTLVEYLLKTWRKIHSSCRYTTASTDQGCAEGGEFGLSTKMRPFVQQLPRVYITNVEERSKIETSLNMHDMTPPRDLVIILLDKVPHSYINWRTETTRWVSNVSV